MNVSFKINKIPVEEKQKQNKNCPKLSKHANVKGVLTGQPNQTKTKNIFYNECVHGFFIM